MTVVTEILNGLENITKPQQKFLAVLFSTMLVVHSQINFLSLSRYSTLSERTFRRQFRRDFDFPVFNQRTAARAAAVAPIAVAQDASFIKKSGKHTFGLDKFWNGSSSRAEKGLEVSLIALVDVEQNRSFALSAEQTPATMVSAAELASETRIDFYLEHFRRTLPHLPRSVKYALVDGFYAKEKFVSGVCAAGYEIVSRLRSDANLRFLFEGQQRTGRGRPRKYAGKVDFRNLTCFEPVPSEEAQLRLYSQRVWSVSLKRLIQVLVLVKNKQPDKEQRVVLFTTDLQLAAGEILRLYRSRFQIEFLFRDAKQSAGLESCQARDGQGLSFHWNASFACVNLGRVLAEEKNRKPELAAFSMKSLKRRIFNEHLLELFISKLELDPTVIKNHEQYEKLRNYAVIST